MLSGCRRGQQATNSQLNQSGWGGTGFSVEVKDNAIAVNTTLSKVITTHGPTLDFGSREHAEAYTSQLSAGDGPLRIQAAPANDPRAVDAYVLADHIRRLRNLLKQIEDVEIRCWCESLRGARGLLWQARRNPTRFTTLFGRISRWW